MKILEYAGDVGKRFAIKQFQNFCGLFLKHNFQSEDLKTEETDHVGEKFILITQQKKCLVCDYAEVLGYRRKPL